MSTFGSQIGTSFGAFAQSKAAARETASPAIYWKMDVLTGADVWTYYNPAFYPARSAIYGVDSAGRLWCHDDATNGLLVLNGDTGQVSAQFAWPTDLFPDKAIKFGPDGSYIYRVNRVSVRAAPDPNQHVIDVEIDRADLNLNPLSRVAFSIARPNVPGKTIPPGDYNTTPVSIVGGDWVLVGSVAAWVAGVGYVYSYTFECSFSGSLRPGDVPITYQSSSSSQLQYNGNGDYIGSYGAMMNYDAVSGEPASVAGVAGFGGWQPKGAKFRQDFAGSLYLVGYGASFQLCVNTLSPAADPYPYFRTVGYYPFYQPITAVTLGGLIGVAHDVSGAAIHIGLAYVTDGGRAWLKTYGRDGYAYVLQIEQCRTNHVYVAGYRP